MSCLIIDTPPETKLGIIEALQANGTSKDLLNLSCTCHPFREILIPEIFKSIVLRNDEKSVTSVQAIADGEYAHHVKELHYQGKHAIPKCEFEQDAEDGQLDDDARKNLLLSGVEKILSDLSCFPKLEKLIVEFPFGNGQDDAEYGLDNDSEWIGSFYSFDTEEDAEQVKKYEQTYGWRAIMAKSFDAIVQNKNSTIRSLELRGTVSKEVSTWSTQAFRDLLNSLDEFNVSIRGNDNGAGWRINTLDAYLTFLGNLGTYFFDHLSNATSISLKTSEYGPIGLEGLRHSPFSIKANSVPLLKSASFDYVFIDPPLVDFVVQHSSTLESISFNYCMGGVDGLSENGIHWHNLFTALIKANPKKLRHFEILPLEVEGVGEVNANQYGDLEHAKKAAKIMKEDESRRAFPYKTLDDKYGMLFDDEDINLEAFLEGKDQRGFDELMEIVKKNIGDAEE